MYYDDRLGTVLRQRNTGESAAKIQFRQLLDLLGTLPGDASGSQIDAAFQRLIDISVSLPAVDRVAILQSPGLRIRSSRLIAILADGEAEVANAAIECAELSPSEWLDLTPALPLHARSLIRLRNDLGSEVTDQLTRLGVFGRALPSPKAAREATAVFSTPIDSMATFIDAVPIPSQVTSDVPSRPVAADAPAPSEKDFTAPEVAVAPLRSGDSSPTAEVIPLRPAPNAPSPPNDEISAIVRRIAEFQQAKLSTEGDPSTPFATPYLPLGESAIVAPTQTLKGFDFATDTSGKIIWAEGMAGTMVYGLGIAQSDPSSPSQSSPMILKAFTRQIPVRGGTVVITGAPAISGYWRIDAVPMFDPNDGRFQGYAGRMRRPASKENTSVPDVANNMQDADRMRQLLHELRTPVNAIQGFAEVIQQQLFGTSPHEYRALAANIAGDAARMLAGFDELDRLAKLESGALEMEPGSSNISEIFAATVARIEHFTKTRGITVQLTCEDYNLHTAMSESDAEKLAWRMIATLAESAAPGETLNLHISNCEGSAQIRFELPQNLTDKPGDEIFRTPPCVAKRALSAGMFGPGFALRLARSEVRAIGGDLIRRRSELHLSAPLMTQEFSATVHEKVQSF